jgi:hypothetical protein
MNPTSGLLMAITQDMRVQIQPLTQRKVKVKQSLYTPWRDLGGEEV